MYTRKETIVRKQSVLPFNLFSSKQHLNYHPSQRGKPRQPFSNVQGEKDEYPALHCIQQIVFWCDERSLSLADD